MSEDTEIVSNMMRSGKYFDASKSWYQTLYIGPISERSFFLVVAALSFLIAIFSFMALVGLLPIHSRPSIIIKNARMDEAMLGAGRIGVRGQPINQEMSEFMLRAYVIAREGYEFHQYPKYSLFLKAHSDAPTWTSYTALYDRSNAKSPAAILGERGIRSVKITDLSINSSVEPKVATVRFTTELEGVANANKTRWTAVLQYYYSDLIIQTVKDPETGDEIITTQDPQFQVVNYVLSQTP